MKAKEDNKDEKLVNQYCRKCKEYTNHRIIVIDEKEKMCCLYCESRKKKKINGCAKSKPKGGWTKIKFNFH